jgi:hypothetical protein
VSARLPNPSTLAAALNDGKEVKAIPTFTHEVVNKVTGNSQEFESPVVLQCATSKRWNVVAVLEDGAYVKTNEFVGNDKSSKNGFYRIDKIQDAYNQRTWREQKAAEAEAKEKAAEVAPEATAEDSESTEAPKAKAPRKRTPAAKKDAA